MTGETGQHPLLRPTSVPVHDDGNMPGKRGLRLQLFQCAVNGAIHCFASRPAWAILELQNFLLFRGEDLVKIDDLSIGEVLDLFLAAVQVILSDLVILLELF